jgi:hypothetical protein
MQLHYVGPKPIISHTGVEFDTNKEDKYVYISIAVEFIKALSHEYIEDRLYTYDFNKKIESEDELMSELQKICPNFKEQLEKEKKLAENELETHISKVKDSLTLKSEEKEVYVKNLNLMYEYIVQRSVNKSTYYCVLEKLAELVKKDHIDHIVVPMQTLLMHVLHSIQGVLREQKFPIDTKMELFKKDGKIHAKLSVINIVDEVL